MARRAYVKVIVSVDETGKVRPLSIEWEDGRIFYVDRLLDVRRAAATKAGGHGMRYTVRIGEKQTYIFCDEQQRWFVEEKDPSI